MNKEIRFAAYAGIFSVLSFIPMMVLGLLRIFGRDELLSSYFKTSYIFMVVISIILTIFFLRGFIIIGKRLKNNFLVITSYLMIFGFIIFELYDSFGLVSPVKINPKLLLAIVISSMLFFGTVDVLFGISLLSLSKKFGGLATTCGVLNIVGGACLITFILIFVQILLYVPLMILQVLLLFRAAEKL